MRNRAKRRPWGQLVAELAAEASEEPFADQATEVVAHLPGGVLLVWDSQQLGDVGAELAAGDPCWQDREQAERLEQGGHARLAELEGGRRLAVRRAARQDEVGQVALAQSAVVGNLFELQQAGVGAVAKLSEGVEVKQTTLEPEVDGSLMVVSVRKARPSLKYCLTSQRLYWTCRLGITPSVMTRVANVPGSWR